MPTLVLDEPEKKLPKLVPDAPTRKDPDKVDVFENVGPKPDQGLLSILRPPKPQGPPIPKDVDKRVDPNIDVNKFLVGAPAAETKFEAPVTKPTAAELMPLGGSLGAGAGLDLPVLPDAENIRSLRENLAETNIVDIIGHIPFSPAHDWRKKGAAAAKEKLRTGRFSPTRRYGMTPMGGFMTTSPPQTASQLRKIVKEQEKIDKQTPSIPAAIASGVADLPGYISEFYALGGPGKAVAGKVLKWLKPGWAKSISTAAVRAGVMTTFQPHRMESSIIDQIERGEGGGMAVLKAWGDVYIENLSEMAGEGFVPFIKRMPLGGKLVDGLHRFHHNAGMSESDFWRLIRTKAGYNGLIAEWGEERVGKYLRTLFKVNDFGAGKDATMSERMAAALDSDWDMRNQTIEVSILSVPGAANALAKTALGQTVEPEREIALGEQVEKLEQSIEQGLEKAKSDTGTPILTPETPTEAVTEPEARVAPPTEKTPQIEPQQASELPEKKANRYADATIENKELLLKGFYQSRHEWLTEPERISLYQEFKDSLSESQQKEFQPVLGVIDRQIEKAQAPFNVYKTTDGSKTGLSEEQLDFDKETGALTYKGKPVVLDQGASGGAVEAGAPPKAPVQEEIPTSEPLQPPAESTPETKGKPLETAEAKEPQDNTIEEIVSLARKPVPDIVEVGELKGTDGKWYNPLGFPQRVDSTGERRVVGYAYKSPEGQTYGTRGKTREELVERHERLQDEQAQEMRSELEKRTPQELVESLKFWQGQTAQQERLRSPRKKSKRETQQGTWEQQKHADVKALQAKRFKTHNDESQIARIEKQLKENVGRFRNGYGVGLRRGRGQVNRGLRIVELYPATHQAKVQYVKDVGQLADYEHGQTETVDTIDLIRDKRFDAAPADKPQQKEGQEPSGGVAWPTAMRQAMQKVKELQPTIELEQSEGRSRQAGGFQGMLKRLTEQGIPASEALPRARAAMAGELTDYQRLESVEKYLPPGFMEKAFEDIRDTNRLGPFERVTADKALKKMQAGRYLAPHEIEVLKKWRPELADVLEKKYTPSVSKAQWLFSQIEQVLGLLKFSAAFDIQMRRQARWFRARHPKLYAQSVVKNIEAYIFQKKADKMARQVETHPRRKEAKRYGVQFLKRHPKPGERTEQYLSHLGEKIPLFGKVYAASMRGFVDSFNWMQMQLWDYKVSQWEREGKKVTHKDLEQLAEFNNTFMGMMPAKTEYGKVARRFLAPVMWSPTLTWSRIRSPEMIITNKAMRVETAGTLASYIGSGLMYMIMASMLAKLVGRLRDKKVKDPVNWNLTSSDFGKIRVQNTRVDVYGDGGPYIRALMQFMLQKKTNQAGRIRRDVGLEPIKQFFRNKRAPIVDMISQIWTQRNYYGGRAYALPDWAEMKEKGGIKYMAAKVGEKITEPGPELPLVGMTPGEVGYYISRDLFARSFVPFFVQGTIEASWNDGWPLGLWAGGEELFSGSTLSYQPSDYSKAQLLQDQSAVSKHDKLWEDLSPKQQDSLRKQVPEINEFEEKAAFERMPAEEVKLSEQNKAAKTIRKALPKSVQNELDNAQVKIPGLSRKWGDFWLNDKRYKAYTSQVATETKKRLWYITNQKHWPDLDSKVKTKGLKKEIDKAKTSVRDKLKKQIESGRF